MPYPSKKFRQNPFTSLRVIRRTDRQTDRTENITSFFGGGNERGQFSFIAHLGGSRGVGILRTPAILSVVCLSLCALKG